MARSNCSSACTPGTSMRYLSTRLGLAGAKEVLRTEGLGPPHARSAAYHELGQYTAYDILGQYTAYHTLGQYRKPSTIR
eukprot:1551425-Rhodomonas_salina.2